MSTTVSPDLALPWRGTGNSPAIALTNTFERVVVINLSRRPDRLARFWSRIERNWPFAAPQRFEAVDGLDLSPPAPWKQGAGAWGCLQSHRAVLDTAIGDRVSSLLVLEDDAYPVEDLPGGAESFLSRVPEDWNCLMFGAEHLVQPAPAGQGVVRCMASIRCHAYAVRGAMMPVLSTFWQRNQTDHCDLVLASLMHHFKAYAPDPPLIGQDAGQSDITAKYFPVRFLAAGPRPEAVINPKIRKILSDRFAQQRPARQGPPGHLSRRQEATVGFGSDEAKHAQDARATEHGQDARGTGGE